jgi:hypothetical protein
MQHIIISHKQARARILQRRPQYLVVMRHQLAHRGETATPSHAIPLTHIALHLIYNTHTCITPHHALASMILDDVTRRRARSDATKARVTDRVDAG